jgi:hypothetical protein
MLVHSKYTYRLLIQEATMLLEPHVNIFNYDTRTMMQQLNLSMRSLVYSLIPLKLWAFKNTANVTHLSPVPLDFVKEIVLVIPGAVPAGRTTEARKVSLREYYQLWNWENCNRWNYARIEHPIYTFAGLSTPGQRRMNILIAPNNEFFTSAPVGYVTTLEIPWTPIQGVLEYYAVPGNVFVLDSPIPFPDEFAELLILDLCIRFISLSADPYRLINLHKEILEKRKELWNNFAKQIIQERREMDVFVEPTPPISDLPPIKGEVENKLV